MAHVAYRAVLALVILSACASAPTANAAPAAAPTGYERAVSRLPARHWALVRSATIDRASGGQARAGDLSIHLTPYRTDDQLWHEVGHVVHYSDPGMAEAWRARFWPDGRLTGTPPSRYARTSWREDFAESYEEMVEHGCLEDRERSRFLRERVFRPGELRGC